MWSSVCPHATARRPICNAVATLPTKSGSHFSVELNASQSLFSFRAATREVSLFSTLLLLSPRPLFSTTPLSSLSSSLFTVSMAKYCRHVKFSNLSAFARRQNPLAKKPQSLNTNRPTIHAGSCPVAAIPTPTELTKILSAAASKKNQNYSFGSISSPGTRPRNPKSPPALSTSTRARSNTHLDLG